MDFLYITLTFIYNNILTNNTIGYMILIDNIMEYDIKNKFMFKWLSLLSLFNIIMPNDISEMFKNIFTIINSKDYLIIDYINSGFLATLYDKLNDNDKIIYKDMIIDKANELYETSDDYGIESEVSKFYKLIYNY